jgi:non-ribosomal peptide synthase protein (TIGR01720 family)
VHDNFFDLGGDSILSIQVVNRAREAGVAMSTKDVFQHPTVADLACVAAESRASRAPDASAIGTLTATPIQHWFLEQALDGAHHFNQAIMLRARSEIDADRLRRVVAALLDHHDALRTRVLERKSGALTIVDPGGETVVSSHDLSVVDDSALPAAVDAEATRVQSSLNLERGPLVRVAHFELGRGRGALVLVVIHHLVVDGVSWRILLDDLNAAYAALEAGRALTLPAKTMPYRFWSERLTERAASADLRRDVGYWQAVCAARGMSLPMDHPDALDQNTVANVDTVSTSLSEEDTRALLQGAHKAYNTRINDLLLAPLPAAFMPWTDSTSLYFNLEGHGRDGLLEDADLTRTVGWFTAIYPVRLDPGAGADAGTLIRHAKEMLRGVPRDGISYGVLRYLCPDAGIRRSLQTVPEPQVSFNYLGQFDNVIGSSGRFEISDMPCGRSIANSVRRRHLVDIVARVIDGRLHVNWVFCRLLHDRAAIAAVAERYASLLRDVLGHCVSSATRSFTPSDFPGAGIGQAQLDALMSRVRSVQKSGST